MSPAISVRSPGALQMTKAEKKNAIFINKIETVEKVLFILSIKTEKATKTFESLNDLGMKRFCSSMVDFYGNQPAFSTPPTPEN